MILVLSGTSDGRALVYRLLEAGNEVIATTTTAYGGGLFETHDGLEVLTKGLTGEEMVRLIHERQVSLLVDATHPYAENGSVNAIWAAEEAQVPYVRYEREQMAYPGVEHFAGYDDLIDYLKEVEGNILLTVGSNNLNHFTDGLKTDRLYARVLPSIGVIQKCHDLGLKPNQIIGMQGPFTLAMNKAMIEQYGIQYMISKESSKVGGFQEKLDACRQMGIGLIVVDRPKVDYPLMFNTIDEVVNYISDGR